MKAPAHVYYCLQGKRALSSDTGIEKKKSATVLSIEPPPVGPPRIANSTQPKHCQCSKGASCTAP